MHDVDDRELIGEFVRTGGERPFAQIVRRHAGVVFGVCRGVLGNSADAEDAAQATFLTLAQKAGSLNASRPLCAWLHRVAWYISVRLRRAETRRKAHEREAAMITATAIEPNPSGGDLELLNEELNRLPERYRVAIILHHLQGLSESQCAAAVGCAVGTLSGRLSRGRQLLRDRIVRRPRRSAAGAPAAVGLAAMFAEQARASVVPVEFADTISRPATLLAAGQSAAPAHLSTRAVVLMEGALRMLFLRKVRWVAALTAVAILLGTGILLTSHATQGGASAKPAPAGDLTGSLVDPLGTPVSGATVRVYRDRQQARSNASPVAVAQSDENGSFKFLALPPSKSYYLLCFRPQPVFMHAEIEPAEVIDTQARDLGVIRMIEGRY